MEPPKNSNIEKRIHNGSQEIVIPHGSGGIFRYFIATFLLFWLGGWVMGFVSAGYEVLSGEANAFIIFWLGGWTMGGGFVMYTVYRIFKKPEPQRLLLNKPNLAFDSGVPPFRVHFGFHTPLQQWRNLFPKRKKMEFIANEIATLKLRETADGNRLTIDSGSDRIEIGSDATEIEREWLYEFLTSNYS